MMCSLQALLELDMQEPPVVDRSTRCIFRSTAQIEDPGHWPGPPSVGQVSPGALPRTTSWRIPTISPLTGRGSYNPDTLALLLTLCPGSPCKKAQISIRSRTRQSPFSRHRMNERDPILFFQKAVYRFTTRCRARANPDPASFRLRPRRSGLLQDF